MRRMTGQLLLILYSFLFLLLSPADLNFVVGFLVSLICIGMQMFLKDDWERYVLLICILAGSWYCVGIFEKQDYEIYTATLQERNRIAREIHDNVGHLLSRSILMVGAIKIVNEDEKLSPSIEQLEESLNTAMTSVRESVHDLHDDSVNLKEVTEELVGEFTFCPVDLSYDMGYDVPREIKYGFIAIVKEALHNIVRHSDASKVKIVMREHPALYQLIVEDNGTVKEPIQSGEVKTVSREFQSGQGMGIRNMSDRVRMLGGMMQIVRKEGFRIFITIPKEVA